MSRNLTSVIQGFVGEILRSAQDDRVTSAILPREPRRTAFSEKLPIFAEAFYRMSPRWQLPKARRSWRPNLQSQVCQPEFRRASVRSKAMNRFHAKPWIESAP